MDVIRARQSSLLSSGVVLAGHLPFSSSLGNSYYPKDLSHLLFHPHIHPLPLLGVNLVHNWLPGSIKGQTSCFNSCHTFLWVSSLNSLVSNMGFPDGSVIKNLPDNAEAAGDSSLIPGWGSSPGGSNDNSLQYCCLENPIDREAW